MSQFTHVASGALNRSGDNFASIDINRPTVPASSWWFGRRYPPLPHPHVQRWPRWRRRWSARWARLRRNRREDQEQPITSIERSDTRRATAPTRPCAGLFTTER